MRTGSTSGCGPALLVPNRPSHAPNAHRASRLPAMVSLRPITDANRAAIEALAVSPSQGRFVSSVRESLREAAEEADAQALYWAVYADETPVGFVMIADEVADPAYIPHFLWKLLIDERYQRHGYGTATLDLIVDYFRSRGVGADVDERRLRRRQPDRVLRAIRLRANRCSPRRRGSAPAGDLLNAERPSSGAPEADSRSVAAGEQRSPAAT